MKKVTVILGLLTGFLFFTIFTGCSDNDNDDDNTLPNDSFVGYWQLIEEGDEEGDMEPVEDGMVMELTDEGRLNFVTSGILIDSYYTYEIKKDGFYKYENMVYSISWDKYSYTISPEYLKMKHIDKSKKSSSSVVSPSVFLYKRVEE